MKLKLVSYTCADCLNVFDAPAAASNAYGSFLLRSETGQLAYLNALNDPVYEEVSGLLERNDRVRDLSAYERSNVLRRIYGYVACDKAEDGSVLAIGAHPVCPHCGSREIKSWIYKSPPEFVEGALGHVSHNGWLSMSETEKIDALDEGVRKNEEIGGGVLT